MRKRIHHQEVSVHEMKVGTAGRHQLVLLKDGKLKLNFQLTCYRFQSGVRLSQVSQAYPGVKTYLKCSCFVIGFQKQKWSLFVTRSLERRFLYSFIVFHCYNQPTTRLDSIDRWWPTGWTNARQQEIFKIHKEPQTTQDFLKFVGNHFYYQTS
jgi:hypothetical protein